MIKNFVFAGGGIAGIAFLGALEELFSRIKMDLDLKRLGGTSAGSIIASLLSVNYQLDELYEIMNNFNFKYFLDESSAKKSVRENFIAASRKISSSEELGFFSSLSIAATIPKVVSRLNEQCGIYDGDLFNGWIEDLLFKKTSIHYLTFEELHQLSLQFPEKYKDLSVVAVNLSTLKTEIFDWEKTPNAIISDAVRSSISIPYVFKPHNKFIKVNGERVVDNLHHIYVDGGLTNNFPITLFDTNTANQETLGFKFHSPTNEVDLPIPEGVNYGLFQHTISILKTVIQQQSKNHAQDPSVLSRTVFIDKLGLSPVSFNLSANEKQRLIASGKAGCASFFEKKSVSLETFLEPIFAENLNYTWDLTNDGDPFPENKSRNP